MSRSEKWTNEKVKATIAKFEERERREIDRHYTAMEKIRKIEATAVAHCQHTEPGRIPDAAGGPAYHFCENCGARL